LGEPVPSGSPHRFLAPVMPSIVVCIGLNYKDHAAEMNKKLPAEPLVFLKPQSSVIGPDDEIKIPTWAGRIEHEAEMAVVIGKRASNVKAPTR
jgi:2-keto-4-pentenoate hydratase/2-oxohepta-3-ene-1,7-dioic acid hydratase in catechol pathway